jgi:hypothetical protein
MNVALPRIAVHAATIAIAMIVQCGKVNAEAEMLAKASKWGDGTTTVVHLGHFVTLEIRQDLVI